MTLNTDPTDENVTEGTAPASIQPVKVGLPPTSTALLERDSNTDFRRQYDQLRGTLQSALSQWDQVYGSLTGEIGRLQTSQVQLGVAQTKLTAYSTERETLNTRLQELQAQAQAAATLKAQNDKLSAVMRFPAIINAATEKATDDGTKTVVNPFLDLVLSSTLEGDLYSNMLAQVAEQLKGQQLAQQPSTPAAQRPPDNPAEMITTPPAPGGSDSVDSLMEQSFAAMDAGDLDKFQELQDRIIDMRAKAQK